MEVISCKNASFGYDGQTVLENVSFSLCSGDYLCIVGENGIGKSTLVRGILQFKSPICGEIRMCGGVKKSDIGYLPQRAQIQKDFPASVSEVVLSGRISHMHMRPFYNTADKKAAEKNMRLMDIFDLKNKSFQELSGGQQQRVLLARALCSAEKMILMDEPVTGLDPVAAREMYSLSDKINKELNVTVIMVTHDIREAIKHANVILHLSQESHFFGKTADYIKSDLGKSFSGGAAL